MKSVAAIRAFTDARLRDRASSAFVLHDRKETDVLETGIDAIDSRIGGFPCAAITELCGDPLITTGADSLVISLLARATQEHFCAVIDATDSFNPRWAHSAGATLDRLLWIRCQERTKGSRMGRLDQALYSADLLLKANCGFGVVVVDLADIPVKQLRQVTLDNWYRFRLAAERLSTALIFSTPMPVTGTSSALVLQLDSSQGEWTSTGEDGPRHAKVVRSLFHQTEIARSRDRKKNIQAVRIPFSSSRSWA